MFGGNNTPFQMPVMPAYGGYGNGNNGLGDDWIALIILAAIFGWGGFGFGGGFGGYGGAGAAGAIDNYVLTSDFSQLSKQVSDGFAGVERRTDAIINGLCDGFYTNAQLIAGVNQNLATQGYETRNAITQTQINQMQNANALQAQLAQCCCDNREAIANVNYNMATQNCATLQAIDKVGDRVIDYLANKENQTLRDENFALRLAASQEKQNNYLVEMLNPNKCPIPAYLTCNPNAPLNYNVTYGNGCGCA